MNSSNQFVDLQWLMLADRMKGMAACFAQFRIELICSIKISSISFS